jgi:hypothetical protein
MDSDLIRLIDSRPIEKFITDGLNSGAFGHDAIEILTEIHYAPDAVVRCRDCKYWQDNNGGYPHQDCKWNANETPDEDDYCSCGERKETDNG